MLNYSVEFRAGIPFVVPYVSEPYVDLLRSKFVGFVCGTF
jgi:hypothetical protein